MVDPEQYVKDILLRKTDRDRQRKVGASNMSNACSRCLADDLLGIPQGSSPYNMGAIVGTAIHEYLEKRNFDTTAHREMRVQLGHIEGYGPVHSTTDLYIPRVDGGMVIDFKTTDSTKLRNYQRADNTMPSNFETDAVRHARSTMDRYFRQAQLYAMGVENAGFTPKEVAIVFLCRDGKMLDRDVWAPATRPYSRKIAELIFDRTVRLWAWLQDGGDPDTIKSRDDCYYCTNVRPFTVPEVDIPKE